MASQPSFAAAPLPRPAPPAWAVGTLLVLAVVAAYVPALRGQFLWDDDSVLSQNGLITASDGLRRIWFSTSATDYWPVSNSAFWLEWRLFGREVTGYHSVSLALAVAAVLLLWRVLRDLRVPGAALGALLFGLHPLGVETVAWIAEQKNLWAFVFFLLSIWAFLKSGLGAVLGRWYGLSLLFFALALLAKGSIAPLPLVLLGLVARRRRISALDLARLAPFFALAIALVLADLWFQKHGTGEVIRQAGFLERLQGAGAALAFYLEKALWPSGLTFVYPQWHLGIGHVTDWLPLIGIGALTAGLAAWARPAAWAWAYFALLLIPVLGFVDVVYLRYSLVADRYVYPALPGLTALVGAGLVIGMERLAAGPGRAFLGRSGPILGLLLAALLFGLTRSEIPRFRDPETLFRTTLASNPDSWMACDQLGVAAFNSGRVGEAIEWYHRALGLKPDLYETRSYLGNALQAQGKLDLAIAQYEESIRIRPTYALAHGNLGAALYKEGKTAEALAEIDTAIRLLPDYAEARNNRGVVLLSLGRRSEAEEEFREALRLDPTNAEARRNLEAMGGGQSKR